MKYKSRRRFGIRTRRWVECEKCVIKLRNNIIEMF